MIITRMALPRRTFLRGVGATLALPLLDAMVPALSAVSKAPINAPTRLGFIYIPNGANMTAWTPTGAGANFELSPTLSPLAPFRDQLLIPTGLAHRQAEALGDGNGDHARASAVWLNGVHPKRTEGADVQAATTLDQLAAQHLGGDTPLSSLELALEQIDLVGNCDNGYSCVYMNTISWRTPTTPLPTENNPRVVFERMFGDGGSAPVRLAQMRKDRSILDSVAQDMARLQKTLGAGDRSTVTDYLDAVRETEQRIRKAERRSHDGELPSELTRPVGVPDSYDEHAKLMFDLQVLAYRADITRVITFLLGREFSPRTYPNIGVPDQHHGLSHHGKNPDKLAKYAKINTYHIELFAYFLDKLRSTRDGDGTLLDHVMLLYGGGISDGDLHSHLDLPLVLAGGGSGQIKGGRVVNYPEVPLANLLLTIADKAGLPAETLGDSTGRLELTTLSDV